MSAVRRVAGPGVLLAVAAAAAVLAVRSGNPALAVLVLVALLCGVGLVALAPPGSPDAAMLARGFAVAPLALPGLLVAYCSFSAGGFFPDGPAVVGIVLLGVLLVRAVVLEHPLAGFSPRPRLRHPSPSGENSLR